MDRTLEVFQRLGRTHISLIQMQKPRQASIGSLRWSRTSASGVVTNYSWDHRGRLVKVEQPHAEGTLTVTFEYDPLDRRTRKLVSSGWGGIDHRYVYDGQHIALELIGVTNTSTVASDVRRRIMHGAAVDKGHHIIPVELWDEFGFASEVAYLLDEGRIPTKYGHKNNEAHLWYTDSVRAIMNAELRKTLPKSGKLSLPQQEAFIKKFIKRQ